MMEKNRQTKVIAIIALVVAVVGMSLGFAAFSNILTISSSATVTPNSEDFKVSFSGSDSDPYDTVLKGTYQNRAGTGYIIAEDAIIVNEGDVSSTQPKVTFTDPGQVAVYYVYAHNVGNYTAYLNKVEFNNVNGTEYKKVCTPLEGATPELVTAACESIELVVKFGGNNYRDTREFSGINIDIGEYVYGQLWIEYLSDGARADGPFTVEFGDVKLYFSTVD